MLYLELYVIKSKLGWHKLKFPVNPEFKIFTELHLWRENLPPFFSMEKKSLV